MKPNYRIGFFTALAVNLLLLGGAGVLWWRSHSAAVSRIAPAAATAASAPQAKVGGGSGGPSQESPLAPVPISSQQLQRIGVRIGKVRRKFVSDVIRTTGSVAVDERGLAYVQVRFAGYIQKVFVDSTYQYVRRGQPLFTIYSPELLSTEREYLLARESQRRLARSPDPAVARDAASLVDAAAERLALWGIPHREIARLRATGRVRQDLVIDSPVTGYVTQREALPNAYAEPGTRLYTVADLSTIWVFAHVFQNDLGRLKVGDRAHLTVDTYPGRRFTGRVDFIYPEIDPSTRTARVRLRFANPTLKLVPGMFVNVSLEAPMGERVVIPASGVLQTGTRQIVFVDRGDGYLEPRDVRLGAEVGDEYIVLEGLKPGERIVTSANFLIDSQSQLQAALSAFAVPPAAPRAAGAPQARLAVSLQPSPPRVGRNLILVTVTGLKGAPVNGAQVSATFVLPAMPAMGMAGKRVSVQLTPAGNGAYRGAVTLTGGGTWQVAVVARKEGRVLAAHQLSVDVAGSP
ncbi:MAG TPA: FixH family protein [Steroidobacteraceae bacterium]|nr:FixH family protein [Steroidobacteraceae bacterium]